MKKKISIFLKRPFVRNVLILVTGTAMAQIINMIFSPFITRIYGAEAYGLMGTFTSIIEIFSTFAALSYPLAIVLPKNNKEVKSIIQLSLYTILIITIGITFVLLIFKDIIITVFNLESVSGFLFLIPFVVFSAGILQIIQQWLIRNNSFEVSAKANVIETLLINIGKLIVGLNLPVASVLIFFTAIKQGLRSTLLYFFSGKNYLKIIFSFDKSEIAKIKKISRKYKDFPLYRTPEVFLSVISNNTPILLLTSLFGPAIAGYYSIAKTVLGVPSTLIAQSVGNVFYPKVAESARSHVEVSGLIIKTTLYLALIAIIPYGFIMIFGPSIFELVFGEGWVVAGEYARWISFWSYFHLINRPSVQALPVILEQKFHLFFTVLKLILTSLSLIIGFYIFENDLIAVALFGVTGAAAYLFLIFMTIIKSRKFDKTNSIK